MEISQNIYLDRLNLFIKINDKEIYIARKECEMLLYLVTPEEHYKYLN